MIERPILYSAPMVRAILEGRKTQTRRIMNPQPVHVQHHVHKGKVIYEGEHRMWCWKDLVLENIWDFPNNDDRKTLASQCPKGKVGDRLWVKETSIVSPKGFGVHASDSDIFDKDGERRIVQYLATNPNRDGANNYKLKATPSIFMPRWASRILTENIFVRVEKLKEITESDSIAEGIEPIQGGTHLWKNYSNRMDESDWLRSPIDSYRSLWRSINGPDSWDANPFVWVIDFKEVER